MKSALDNDSPLGSTSNSSVDWRAASWQTEPAAEKYLCYSLLWIDSEAEEHQFVRSSAYLVSALLQVSDWHFLVSSCCCGSGYVTRSLSAAARTHGSLARPRPLWWKRGNCSNAKWNKQKCKKRTLKLKITEKNKYIKKHKHFKFK